MKQIIFRVECNSGSKYFDNSIQAFKYYDLKREQPMTTVEVWQFVSPNEQRKIAPLNDPTREIKRSEK
jgi:hypothetical protein